MTGSLYPLWAVSNFRIGVQFGTDTISKGLRYSPRDRCATGFRYGCPRCIYEAKKIDCVISLRPVLFALILALATRSGERVTGSSIRDGQRKAGVPNDARTAVRGERIELANGGPRDDLARPSCDLAQDERRMTSSYLNATHRHRRRSPPILHQPHIGSQVGSQPGRRGRYTRISDRGTSKRVA